MYRYCIYISRVWKRLTRFLQFEHFLTITYNIPTYNLYTMYKRQMYNNNYISYYNVLNILC